MLNKKLVLLFAILSLIVISSNFISAGINYNETISAGQSLNLTIDFDNYGSFIYFYNSGNLNNSLYTANLGCNTSCIGKKNFLIPLSANIFLGGNYSFSLYSFDDKSWKIYTFKIIGGNSILNFSNQSIQNNSSLNSTPVSEPICYWVTRQDPNFCGWCSNGENLCWPWYWRVGWDAIHCGTHTVNDHQVCA